jgi:hypothetical protein
MAVAPIACRSALTSCEPGFEVALAIANQPTDFEMWRAVSAQSPISKRFYGQRQQIGGFAFFDETRFIIDRFMP